MWKNVLLIGLLLGILGVVPVWVEGDIFDNPPNFNQKLQLPGSSFTDPIQEKFKTQPPPPLNETPEERFIRENKPSDLTPQQQLQQGLRQTPSGGNTVTIQNPIAANDFNQLVGTIARAVTGIAMVLATLAIIIVGFQFVMASASGNEQKLTEAKKALLWVLIGTAIVVSAVQLAGGIIEFAGQIEQKEQK